MRNAPLWGAGWMRVRRQANQRLADRFYAVLQLACALQCIVDGFSLGGEITTVCTFLAQMPEKVHLAK